MPSSHRDLPFDIRQSEATNIKKRYPNRIPVICERYPRTNLPILDKKKYLVPCNMMIGEFKYIIHKHLCMASAIHGSKTSFDKTVYLFAGGQIPKAGAIMQDVYEELKDPDGFLYMQYSAENTLVCALWVHSITICYSYRVKSLLNTPNIRLYSESNDLNHQIVVENDIHSQQEQYANELNSRLYERLNRRFDSATDHINELTSIANEIYKSDSHPYLFNLSKLVYKNVDDFPFHYKTLWNCQTPITLYVVKYRHDGIDRIAIDGTSESLICKTYLALLLSALHTKPISEVESIIREKGQEYENLTRFNSGSSKNIYRFINLKLNDSEIREGVTSFNFKRLIPKKSSSRCVYIRRYGFEYNNLVNNSEVNKIPSVAMLLSGGVDSSVALWLLKSRGYDVHAFYLRAFDTNHPNCISNQDIRYARDCCNLLGVPLHVMGIEEVYHNNVIRYMIEGYRVGNTPNPDILCNNNVKFGYFLNKCIDYGFDFVASGHYAILSERKCTIFNEEIKYNELALPNNIKKDQTYFLSRLPLKCLNKMLCPIGYLSKTYVRRLAYINDFPTKNREESMGVCFLGKVNVNEFLKDKLGDIPGDVIDYKTKKVIGTHNGLYNYTIGQRHGLKSSINESSELDWVVLSKDVKNNVLYVTNEYNSSYFIGDSGIRRSFSLAHIRWNNPIILNKNGINDGFYLTSEWEPSIQQQDIGIMQDLTLNKNVLSTENVYIKVRNNNPLQEAELKLSHPIHDDNGFITQHGWVKLKYPDSGLANGQYASIYLDKVCIGSGIICQNSNF